MLRVEDVEKQAGLSKTEILKRLQNGLEETSWLVDSQAYESFRGFWGEAVLGDGRVVVVVSDRPSRQSYPQPGTTALSNVLRKAGYIGVHFTDFIKRRGERSSTVLPDGEKTGLYADILVEELAILAGEANRLHIVPSRKHAAKLLETARVIEQLQNRLGPTRVTQAAEVPIFPYGTSYGQGAVVASWTKALN